MPIPGQTDVPGSAQDPAVVAEKQRREEEERKRREAELLAAGSGSAPSFGPQPVAPVAAPPPGLTQGAPLKPGIQPANLGAVAPPPAGLQNTYPYTPLLGGPGSTADPLRDLRDKFLAERAGVGGPAPTLATGPADQARGLLLDQAGRLGGIASGLTPSVADFQRQAALFDVNQTALGAAGGMRGDAGASRTLFRSLGDQGRRVGIDAAAIKAGEMNQANALLGSLLGDVRAGDTDIAGKNLEAGLKSRGIDVEERTALGKLGLEAQTTESETRLREAQIKKLQDDIDFAYAQLKSETDAKKREFWGNVITSSIAAIAGVGAAAAGRPKA